MRLRCENSKSNFKSQARNWKFRVQQLTDNLVCTFKLMCKNWNYKIQVENSMAQNSQNSNWCAKSEITKFKLKIQNSKFTKIRTERKNHQMMNGLFGPQIHNNSNKLITQRYHFVDSQWVSAVNQFLLPFLCFVDWADRVVLDCSQEVS